MLLLLFTVSVTALATGALEPEVVFSSVLFSLSVAGVRDAAVTMDDESVSFTGQVQACNALSALSQATHAMAHAGFNNVSAMTVEPCHEEDHAVSNLRIAVG